MVENMNIRKCIANNKYALRFVNNNSVYAIGFYLKKYWQSIKNAWVSRENYRIKKYDASEAKLLTPVEAILNQPPPYGVDKIGVGVILFVITLLLWAILGKLDVVISAQGQVRPVSGVRPVSAVDSSRISHVYVSNGDTVVAGQKLLDFESDLLEIDVDRNKAGIIAHTLQIARARSVIRSVEFGKFTPPIPPDGATADQHATLHSSAYSLWQDYNGKRNSYEQQIKSSADSLNLIGQKKEMYEELNRSGEVSNLLLMDSKKEFNEGIQRLNEIIAQSDMTKNELLRLMHEQEYESTKVMLGLLHEFRAAHRRTEQRSLYAPLSGIVENFNLRTSGDLIPGGGIVLNIIPDDAILEIEAYIDNKDLAFVKVGQDVSIKFAALDYVKYGIVSGRVKYISQDARSENGSRANGQNPESMLLKDSGNNPHGSNSYLVRIDMNTDFVPMETTVFKIKSGMSATLDINIGTRSPFEYFLSPITRTVKEGMRER